MKTVSIMDWVSRANGGIFEAERRLQQTLHAKMGIDVQVVGLRDAYTERDLESWSPLTPVALPVTGPQSFGYAPDFGPTLAASRADIGYVAGLWKYPSVAAQRWSRATGKPLVNAPHGMLDPWAVRNSGFKKKVAGWLFQNAQLREAACLRALCPAEAASFRQYGLKNPICIVPNGIDLPVLARQDLVRHPKFPVDRKVLLYLGRLHPKKNLAPLIAAWHKARPAGGEWILAIAGWDQGGYEMELKRQATSLGLAWSDGSTGNAQDTSIVFLGPQFGRDKELCYASCDAFVLPSLSEGLPMVVLEAWAYAKPVLMTRECNLPEGFAAEAALKIDLEGLEAGLRKLFDMSAENRRAMGDKGRALVEERFEWRNLAAQMTSVYEWVLGGGPKPVCIADG